MDKHPEHPESGTDTEVLDVTLIGGGIMSATLGAMIAALQPEWSMTLLERLDRVAAESSDPWNNAGTGHSGLCELNYMPDPGDADKAAEIAAMFAVSRQFWAGLADRGDLTGTGFLTATPHMDVVFGERDVSYLRRRFETLRALPAFAAMEYSEDHATIEGWAPLVMAGRAALGAPPMSVPHLDKRNVDGRSSLLFGPYATFSTRLLKHGRLTDLFTTLRLTNIVVLVAAGLQNLPLVRYLITELLSTRRRKFAQLQRFYPEADPADWYLVQAGQRAQLVTPDLDRVGVLRMGTELVTGADGTIAGLLGASPGASTAPAIMADLLDRCFPQHRSRWEPTLRQLVPGHVVGSNSHSAGPDVPAAIGK
ncbi:malate:quinone oxidoreductase [Nocardia tengchongensis]|uniref:malate:quinone oxidoreductase n=1 Tax=Nocardia tengchongensis TaxID=2055889 RepID=UPI0036A46CE5